MILFALAYIAYDHFFPSEPIMPPVPVASGDEAQIDYISKAISEGAYLQGFYGGSMRPVLDSEKIALVRSVPFSEVRTGQIVVFKEPDGESVTAHRVVSRDTNRLNTKGDANAAPDKSPVTADRYIGVIRPNEIFDK